MKNCLWIAGFGRTDCALVMNGIFQSGIITKESLVVKSALFKATLCPKDKNSWYPVVRENSFDNKCKVTNSSASSICVIPKIKCQLLFLNDKIRRIWLLFDIWQFYLTLLNNVKKSRYFFIVLLPYWNICSRSDSTGFLVLKPACWIDWRIKICKLYF